MRLLLALTLLVSLVPAAAACGGLSPGDQIESGGSLCTLAFVVANKDGLFFATAGHCVSDGATVASPDVGEIGTAVFRHLDPDTGASTDGSPGEDFALIRIHPGLYAQLNPKLCGWPGPTGLVTDDSADGRGVRHYGHGLVFGETEQTRPREGANLVNEGPNYAFYWTGAGLPGDSGSAVITDDGRALGVLTHVTIRPPDTNGGTHLLRGFELAEAAGFAPLRLVLAGEDPVAVLAELRGSDGATPPEEAPPTTSTPPTSATPGNETPPSNSTNDTQQDNVSLGGDGAPGATTDDAGGAQTPGAPLALVLLVLSLVAARGRRRA